MPTLINSFSLSSTIGIGTNTPNKALTVVGDISATKSLFADGDATIGGSLTVLGSATYLNTNNLTVEDPLIYLAASNVANLNDIGIVGHFTDTLNNGSANRAQHTGFVRRSGQSSPGAWTLFSGLTTEPASATNLNWSDATLQYDNLNVGSINSIGNLTVVGNISATNIVYASRATFLTSISAPSLSGTHYGDGSNITNIRSSNITVPVTTSSTAITTYTLTVADHGKTIFFNNTSSLSATVPVSTLFDGYTCEIVQLGTGSVTVIPAAGVNIYSFGQSYTLAGRWATCRVIQLSSNVFHLAGNLTT